MPLTPVRAETAISVKINVTLADDTMLFMVLVIHVAGLSQPCLDGL